MRVKNESHDEFETADATATVGAQRQPAEHDAGILWSRDSGGTDDRVVADQSAEERAEHGDAVDAADARARADDAEATDAGVDDADAGVDDSDTGNRTDEASATDASVDGADTENRADADAADAGVDDADTENGPDDADAADARVDEDAAADVGVGAADADDRAGDAEPAVDPVAAQRVPAQAVTANAQTGPAPVDAVWTDADRQRYREGWREVQLRFVDDPHAAVEDAEGLVGDAVDGLIAALTDGVNNLAEWRSSDRDTEQLRVAVRRYREFLDRVLGGQ
jgi:hypothetical protein